jgi:hypothetical protein
MPEARTLWLSGIPPGCIRFLFKPVVSLDKPRSTTGLSLPSLQLEESLKNNRKTF